MSNNYGMKLAKAIRKAIADYSVTNNPCTFYCDIDSALYRYEQEIGEVDSHRPSSYYPRKPLVVIEANEGNKSGEREEHSVKSIPCYRMERVIDDTSDADDEDESISRGRDNGEMPFCKPITADFVCQHCISPPRFDDDTTELRKRLLAPPFKFSFKRRTRIQKGRGFNPEFKHYHHFQHGPFNRRI